MGASHQALLMGGGVLVSDIIKSASAYPASNFTMSGASYVDLLDAAGGATVSVSFTKSASTNLLVAGGLNCTKSTATDTILAVNDGTNDTPLARSRVNASPNMVQMYGEAVISGLSAGTYTLKLRVASTAGSTMTFSTTNSAFITVTEIDP